ncbi:sensor histidine kinase [Krasilnikovia sp. M28-CT-15]|uniref:sensor histidine kinase n=1 Tax=Krasilnikovia sp. M28-CT-15 TaxID=3373540 RepID=UPI00387747A6
MTAVSEPSTTPSAAGRRRPGLGRVLRRAVVDSVYLLTGFPLALAGWILAVVGLAAGAGMVIIVVGVPILMVTVLAVRGLAEAERFRIRRVLGDADTHAAYRRAAPGTSRIRRWLMPLTDLQSWLDVAHTVALFPLALLTWSVALIWWVTALAGVSAVVWHGRLPGVAFYFAEDVGGSPAVRTAVMTGIGVLALLTLPFAMRAMTLGQALFGKALLVDIGRVRGRVARLERDMASAEARTAAAMSAEATALRRLERDIHDGPQQRLVRLAMDLGRAQQQLDRDPRGARDTVGDAIAQTKEALAELRALSRGIAPPVLLDRGLAAAVTALAARSTVPVDLDAAELGRLDAGVETVAYFVLAESLTNVAKHSHATECTVSMRRDEDRLVLTVVDNGVGGAALAKGHGLAGLADRVHAAGGELHLTSPLDGPTSVSAWLPWR